MYVYGTQNKDGAFVCNVYLQSILNDNIFDGITIEKQNQGGCELVVRNAAAKRIILAQRSVRSRGDVHGVQVLVVAHIN